MDIDAFTAGRRAGGFRGFFGGDVLAKDHLDGRGGTLREAFERYAAREGFEPGEGRILVAAQPRALGFCFNPISVWWCLDTSGDLVATVVEVHNTYGDRHAYLLGPGPTRRAEVPKAMYVSPFYGVDGSYDVIAPPPGDRLDLSVTLHPGEGSRFSASLAGHVLESPRLWTAWASPCDALRIRLHGIRLWARRLPVHPRPDHHQEALT